MVRLATINGDQQGTMAQQSLYIIMERGSAMEQNGRIKMVEKAKQDGLSMSKAKLKRRIKDGN